MTADKRKPEFWDVPDAEIIQYDSLDTAVEMFLDGAKQPLPRKVTIAGYACKKFDISAAPIAEHIAESLDEWLTEDFGNPDDCTTLPKELNDAIEVLATAVVKHWPVWQYEEVTRVTVDAHKWLKENRPAWLKENLTWEENDE